jgi:hypothetical protein
MASYTIQLLAVGARMHHLGLCAVLFATVTLVNAASAGEIGGGISSCDLGGFRSCEWKASRCHKPWPPSTFATDVFTYNMAVGEYNRFVNDSNEYIRCLGAEGKRDISDGFPAVVKESIDKAAKEIDRDISSAKSSLDMTRSFIRR